MAPWSTPAAAAAPPPQPAEGEVPVPGLSAENDLRDAADAVRPAGGDDLHDAAPSGVALPESPIKDREDLKRLNRRATQQGMYIGFAGGGVLAYAARRLKVPGNGVVLTFLLSSTGISFLYTRAQIRTALGAHYAAARAAAEPAAPGGGTFMADSSAGDRGAPRTGEEAEAPLDPRAKLIKELEAIPLVGSERERTRWAKGRGLAGEVEEEPEMRDNYFRAGTPRRDA